MAVRRLELDAPALKALAHPLRVQLLRELDARPRMSVTGLAAELGESTATVSYHLRQLARYGLVEPSDGAENPAEDAQPTVGRRQRFWRMAVDEVHMSALAFEGDAASQEALGFLAREMQSIRNRRLMHWFATDTEWPDVWRAAASDGDATLVLDPAQARAMADELIAVVHRYREVPPGAAARRVEVQWAVFPLDDGPRP